MLELTANILYPTADVEAVVITTNKRWKKNGHAVMGKGLALAADKRWQLSYTLGKLLQAGHTNTTIISHDHDHPGGPLAIVALPTKDDWRNPSTPKLILEGILGLLKLADKYKWRRVWVPMLGCSNGGLNPKHVKPVMAGLLDERFTLITRY